MSTIAENPASPDPTPPGLTIDIVSDVVCPWCYIGKKHLDEALARWRERHPEAAEPAIEWYPFQLNPAMPREGMDRGDYLRSKFGDPRGGPGYLRVVGAAKAAGLEFNPDEIRRQPNTLRAHSLIRAAGPARLQHRLYAALFQAYFVEGANIGDPQVLRTIAGDCGMDAAAIDAALGDDALKETAAIDQQMRDAGIGGVPYFIIGRKFAVSGAQGADALFEVFERVAEAQSA